jgi:hypothetical protein
MKNFLDELDEYKNGVTGGHRDNLNFNFDTPESWINFATEDANIPMVMHIFDNIGIHHNFVLDMGAYSSMASNVYPVMKRYNIDGLLIDGENKHNDPLVKSEWITTDNICQLLDTYGCPKNIDYISLDIDNMDYWILKNILIAGYSTNLLVLEFNPIFSFEESFTKEYDASSRKDGTSNYGASLCAFSKLLEPYGYRLIQVLTNNAYFINEKYDVSDKFIDVEKLLRDLHPSPYKETHKKNFSNDINVVRQRLKEIFVEV